MSSDLTRALATCAANDPGSQHWSERSFVGRLTEYAVFDQALYEALERAIVIAAREQPSAETVWCLLRILERVTLLTAAHRDPSDVYRMEGAPNDDVLDFENQFRFLLRDLSTGRGP